MTEAVVAFGILFVSVALMGTLLVRSFGSVTFSRQRQVATALANQVLEQVRALPFDQLDMGNDDLAASVAAGEEGLAVTGSGDVGRLHLPGPGHTPGSGHRCPADRPPHPRRDSRARGEHLQAFGLRHRRPDESDCPTCHRAGGLVAVLASEGQRGADGNAGHRVPLRRSDRAPTLRVLLVRPGRRERRLVERLGVAAQPTAGTADPRSGRPEGHDHDGTAQRRAGHRIAPRRLQRDAWRRRHRRHRRKRLGRRRRLAGHPQRQLPQSLAPRSSGDALAFSERPRRRGQRDPVGVHHRRRLGGRRCGRRLRGPERQPR